MAIRVGPTEPRPTHHIKLTYSTDDVGLILCDARGNADPRAFSRNPMQRSSIKMYQGNMGASDLELPWSPVVQDDWSGGALSESFDSAGNRYERAQFVDTQKEGEICVGGLETPTLLSAGNSLWSQFPNSRLWKRMRMSASWKYIAMSFTPTANYTSSVITFPMMRHGEPAMLIQVYSDDSNKPGAALGTLFNNTVYFPHKDVSDTVTICSTGVALTAGTKYWLVWYSNGDATNYVELIGGYNTGEQTALTSADAATWTGLTATMGVMFIVQANTALQTNTKLFQYKGSIYAVSSAGALWINGEQTVAASATSTTITVAGTPWTADEWIGCVCVLIAGTGSNEKINFRPISDNANNQITLESAWDVTPDNTTEFVIIGSNKWTSLTITGQPTAVTDVLVNNGNVYFAQGDSADIIRMRAYNNSGTWTRVCTAQTSHYGTYMIAQPDSDDLRVLYIQKHGKLHWEIAPIEGADLPAYATTNEKQVGDTVDRVNGIQLYDEDNALWVFKESGPWICKGSGNEDDSTFTYTPLKFKLNEIAAAGDYRLGAASASHNVYLYFSLQDTLQRYYSGNLDSVGLDQGTGLPKSERGNISALVGYPGRLLAAVEAHQRIFKGSSAYDANFMDIIRRPSIWSLYNGWHPIYTGGVVLNVNNTDYTTYNNFVIRSMLIQTLPGESVDRLWFCWGHYAMWMPIAIRPPRDLFSTYQFYQYFPYRYEGHLITSWFYVNLRDITKFWHTLKLLIANFTTESSVLVDYQTGTLDLVDFSVAPGDWTYLDTWTVSTIDQDFYSEEKTIGANAVSGKRFRLRFRLRSGSFSEPPVIRGSVIETMVRVPTKRTTTVTFRISDYDFDLNGNPDDENSGDDKLTLLETWEAMALPVTVSAHTGLLNGKSCFIDPYSLRLLTTIKDGETGREVHVCQMSLIEV